MAIAYAGNYSGFVDGTGTSVAVPKPTGVAVGDAVFVTVVLLTTGKTISGPAGFTKIGQVTATTNGFTQAFFVGPHDGSASYTFTWDGTSQSWEYTTWSYTGTHTTTPVNTSTAPVRNTTTTVTIGAATPSVAGTLIVPIVVNYQGVSTTPPSGGYTERFDDTAYEASDLAGTNGVSTGTLTATLSGAGESASCIVVLQPPAGGTTFNDSGSGTLALSGSGSVAASYDDAGSGQLTLTGSGVTSVVYDDAGSGSLMLSGSGVEDFQGPPAPPAPPAQRSTTYTFRHGRGFRRGR